MNFISVTLLITSCYQRWTFTAGAGINKKSQSKLGRAASPHLTAENTPQSLHWLQWDAPHLHQSAVFPSHRADIPIHRQTDRPTGEIGDKSVLTPALITLYWLYSDAANNRNHKSYVGEFCETWWNSVGQTIDLIVATVIKRRCCPALRINCTNRSALTTRERFFCKQNGAVCPL